jgi:putative endonuclease
MPSTLNKKILGDIGEDKALEFLTQQGLNLIERNFHSRFGEIDLIMHQQNYLIFIEVRSRKNMGFGSALESITLTKQQKLRKTADYFFLLNSQYNKVLARFDVIIIPKSTSPYNNNKEPINWIKNAF